MPGKYLDEDQRGKEQSRLALLKQFMNLSLMGYISLNLRSVVWNSNSTTVLPLLHISLSDYQNELNIQRPKIKIVGLQTV